MVESGRAEPPVWHGLAAGAVSGIISRGIVYPADNLKAQIQVQSGILSSQGLPKSTSATTAALFQQMRAEGLRGIYRGFSVVLLGVVPGNMCYFGGYELGKRTVSYYEQSRGVYHNSSIEMKGLKGDLMTGAIAQCFAGLFFTPMDAIKERMQAQTLMGGAYHYKNGLDGLVQIVRQNGMQGLLRGYWITNTVWLPWNMINIATYEASKRKVLETLQDRAVEDKEKVVLPTLAYPACAAFSSGFAALLTNPIDVVKTRVQVMRGDQSKNKSIRALDIVRLLWKNEGIGGFTAGLLPRIFALAPGCALSWMIYENVKIRLDELSE